MKNKDSEKKKNKKLKKEKKLLEITTENVNSGSAEKIHHASVENTHYESGEKVNSKSAENSHNENTEFQSCNCDDAHSNCGGIHESKSSDDMCGEKHIHGEAVELVRERMPKEELLVDLADLFKVFGDSTRTKIISALFLQELCVCDIAEIVNMSISAVSHQLRILRNTKIVKNRKVGKEVFYSLDDNHVYQIFQMGLAHLTH